MPRSASPLRGRRAKDNVPVIEEFTGESSKTFQLLNGSKVQLKKEYQRRALGRLLADVFLPEGYPHSVTSDYLSYQMWDTAQALCSSVLGVLASRAVLRGLGVGNEEATVMAAALSWLYRDGTGMISRILFAWYEGTLLDSNSKTWRLIADITNDLAMAMDLLSPVWPDFFLYFVCAGSVLRSITGVAGGSTRAALTQHFAIKDNLGDVSAKDGSQETLVGLAGLFIGMAVTRWLPDTSEITTAFFIIFVALHLFCNYSGLRAIHLTVFNRQRLNLVLEHYAKHQSILSIDAVAQREKVLWWDNWRIELGASLESLSEAEFAQFCDGWARFEENKFHTVVRVGRVLVLLHEAADSDDILEAYVVAYRALNLATAGGFDWRFYNALKESACWSFPIDPKAGILPVSCWIKCHGVVGR